MITTDTKAAAVSMREARHSIKDISAELQISEKSVVQIMKDAGLAGKVYVPRADRKRADRITRDLAALYRKYGYIEIDGVVGGEGVVVTLGTETVVAPTVREAIEDAEDADA